MHFVSSKLKVGFGFNHRGFSGIIIGAMSSKCRSECSKCDFTQSPKGGIVSLKFSHQGLTTQSYAEFEG